MANNKKLKIGVIFGGRSGEHEVSLVSAQSVINALDKKKYEVVLIGITRQGKWVTGSNAMQFLKTGIEDIKQIMPAGFLPDPTQKGLVEISKGKGLTTVQPAGLRQVDVFFPVLHGPFGEDGTIQGVFEMAGVPYVGSGVLGSAVGMDKIIQNQLYDRAGLRQAKYFWFLKKDWPSNSVSIKKQARGLGYPVFVKPANLGSSVGISKAHNKKELIKAIILAGKYDRKILVEQGIEGAREIECSVLGNDFSQASIPGEIISSNEFYDYDAKYVDGKSKAIIPAKLSAKVKKEIMKKAVLAFKVLDLAGMARVDFFVKGNDIYINEVNTIPGFTAISMYPKLWEASGLSYPKLLDKLIELALERWQEKQKLLSFYKPKKDWYK